MPHSTDGAGPVGRRRHRPVRIAAAAVLGGLVLGGCADGREAAETPVVSVGDIAEEQYFHEGDYLGRRVTVRAQVTDVLGPRSVELAARAYGDDSLLVQTPAPVAVRPGQRVQVVGTVGQYHVYMPDQVPPVNHDNYEKYETEAYLYGSTVSPLPG